jgi:hypothetical protein
LPSTEQGPARFRRGTQPQDPRHPAARIGTARRGVPATESPYVQVAKNLNGMHFYPHSFTKTH